MSKLNQEFQDAVNKYKQFEVTYPSCTQGPSLAFISRTFYIDKMVLFCSLMGLAPEHLSNFWHSVSTVPGSRVFSRISKMGGCSQIMGGVG